ncbi:MAG: hypothetical protein M1837_006986 [Sclerophora amabilis]|nr:MAG: hypothetical protein M1837_006986 [Sclerophora amabilis]
MPPLSGIMDTINSTLAHGPETRLPEEFYDSRGRDIIDTIGCEEWFSGYKESAEYRSLGIGALLGDIVTRMAGSINRNGNDGLLEIGGDDANIGIGRGGEKDIKFAISGCHDTTLAAILASLGAFEGEFNKWPPYTSHVAIELFRKRDNSSRIGDPQHTTPVISASRPGKAEAQQKSLWDSLFGNFLGDGNRKRTSTEGIGRKSIAELNQRERSGLDDYFVRLRFNERPVVIPGCKIAGNHLEGNESFCTFVRVTLLHDLYGQSPVAHLHNRDLQEAFKNIVDEFTPRNWKQACASNLDQPAFPAASQPAGFSSTLPNGLSTARPSKA